MSHDVDSIQNQLDVCYWHGCLVNLLLAEAEVEMDSDEVFEQLESVLLQLTRLQEAVTFRDIAAFEGWRPDHLPESLVAPYSNGVGRFGNVLWYRSTSWAANLD